MKKLLLLMVAACMTLAIGAQGTKFNGKIQPKKARTEMSVAKRQAKKSAGKSAALKAKGGIQRNAAVQSKTSVRNLRLRKSSGVKKATLNYTADTYLKAYYSDTEDWWNGLSVSEDECEFHFDILTTQMVNGKKYTSANKDFDLDYSFAIIGDDYIEANSIEFTWTKNNDGSVKVVAQMVCADGNTYNVTYYKEPTPATVGTVTRNYDDASFTDGRESLGIIQFVGEKGEEMIAIAYVTGGDIIGTYDFNQIYPFYSYISPDEETYYDIIDGTVTVTISGDNYVCEAKVIGSDLKFYDLTFTAPMEQDEVLEYDCEDSNFNYTFGKGDKVSVDDEYVDYFGVAYLDVESAKGDLYACLEFNIESTDPEIIIPEGVYAIDRSMDYGTVTASEGVDEDGYLTVSYVVTCDEDGYVTDPIWFLVSGTVTVTNEDGKLKVVVDGVNSYGRTVVFTAIDETTPLPTPGPGEGLVYNGGFEDWTTASVPTGWEGWQIAEKSNTGGAKLQQSTDSHSGNYACFVTGDASNKRLATQKLNLAADTYVVGFWAKSDNGCIIKPGMATVQANGSANYDYGDYAKVGISLTPSWKYYTYEFTLEEDTEASMLIMNYKNSGDCLIDDYVLVTKSYADGIRNIESNKADNRLFNLAGQVVGNDYKGIVISGGKKFLKK